MKQISNKEYEKYQQYQTDKLHGRILTPDGLRVICAGLDNEADCREFPYLLRTFCSASLSWISIVGGS